MEKWPTLFKCTRNMLPAHVGNSEKCVGNIPAIILIFLQNANVLEEMERMVEYSCMCRKKRSCILRRPGILPTRAGSIVPAHLQMCRKLLCEVVPSFEIYAST